MLNAKCWSDREVAELTGLSRRTLQNWRALKKGPPYIKVGRRCLYLEADVQGYLEANKVKVLGN